jgi:hypothetical protein
MREILGQATRTLANGVILSVARYCDSTQTRQGPPHCRLVAQRGDKTLGLEVECVSAGALEQLLGLYARNIERLQAKFTASPQPTPEAETLAGFVVEMAAAGFFMPEKILAPTEGQDAC